MAEKASAAGAPPQSPLTNAELAELREELRVAMKSDEHLCPEHLAPTIFRLIDEVRVAREFLRWCGWSAWPASEKEFRDAERYPNEPEWTSDE